MLLQLTNEEVEALLELLDEAVDCNEIDDEIGDSIRDKLRLGDRVVQLGEDVSWPTESYYRAGKRQQP